MLNADPNVVAIVPQEPYVLLGPGVEIQEGDLKCLVGANQLWSLVSTHEHGHEVPVSGIAYARVGTPEGYVLRKSNEDVMVSDLVWLTEWAEWRPATMAEDYVKCENVARAAARYRSAKNGWLFVAAAKFAVAASEDLPLPARHRELYPREKLRRGDKVTYAGLGKWTEVDPGMFDQDVELPSVGNAQLRCCRPTHAFHQSWYVDAEKGKPEGLGGFSDPFPSVEAATATIENAARKAGSPPYGVIYNLAGFPLMVYDMPAPEAPTHAPPVEAVVEEAPVAETPVEVVEPPVVTTPMPTSTEDVLTAIRKAPEPATSSHYMRALESRSVLPKHRTAIDEMIAEEDGKVLTHLTQHIPSENMAEATRTLPKGYRIMVAGEEIKRGDLWYATQGAYLDLRPDPDANDLMVWQPVNDNTLGIDVATMCHVYARRIAPVPSKRLALQTELNNLAKLQVELGHVMDNIQTILNTMP